MSTSARDYRDSGIGEDFVPPPPGPPPPIVPEGWVAKFDERYQQFYYVNIATKKSQWDKPPGTIDLPARAPGELKQSPSYNDKPTSSVYNYNDTATRLITPQEQPQSQSQYPNTTQPSPPASHSPSHGLAGRLSSFFKPHSPNPPKQQEQYYAPQGYYQQQDCPTYGSSGYMQVPPHRSGMGVGSAVALGAGGGLLGGMMLADAFDDHNVYEQGFEDGADFGGRYSGGDMGDFGGGDY